jgi:hypothetical protein
MPPVKCFDSFSNSGAHPCSAAGYDKVKGSSPQTVHAGEVFYQSPTDLHIVSRNASETEPAKLLVFYVKAKGTPPSVLLGEGERYSRLLTPCGRENCALNRQ